jgi:hypothetical protein
VAGLPPPLGVEKVVGERGGVALGEAERPEPLVEVARSAQERTGSGLNACRAAWIASAIATIA